MESNKSNKWHKLEISKLKFKRNKVIKQNDQIHLTLIAFLSALLILFGFEIGSKVRIFWLIILGILMTITVLAIYSITFLNKTSHDKQIIKNFNELQRRAELKKD